MADKPTDGHIEWIPDDDTNKYIAPSSAKKLQGWIAEEKPPFQYFNWFWRLVDRWLQWAEAQSDENVAAIATNAQAIADEATTRSGADSTLQGNIDSEASTRASADSTHAALTSPHSATSAATANRLIVRDASGRAKVAAPSASDDIARKNEVDAEATARATADSTHAALTAPHSASATATANRLALRDGSGDLIARMFRSEYATPSGGCNYFAGQVALGSGADNYLRPMTIAQAAAILGLTNGAVISAYALNTNYGYIRFTRRDGSNGPMVQWDNRFDSTQDAAESFTFAYAFPNACAVVFTQRLEADDSIILPVTNLYSTGFIVDRDSDVSNPCPFAIIAIGY
jgi:hypothetical protein